MQCGKCKNVWKLVLTLKELQPWVRQAQMGMNDVMWVSPLSPSERCQGNATRKESLSVVGIRKSFTENVGSWRDQQAVIQRIGRESQGRTSRHVVWLVQRLCTQEKGEVRESGAPGQPREEARYHAWGLPPKQPGRWAEAPQRYSIKWNVDCLGWWAKDWCWRGGSGSDLATGSVYERFIHSFIHLFHLPFIHSTDKHWTNKVISFCTGSG